MIWLMAVALAVAALALGIVAFRVPKAGWTSLAAALTIGLAGYATQAQPGHPGAPAATKAPPPQTEGELIEIRRILTGSAESPLKDGVITADAMMRRGRYEEAAAFLGQVTQDHPKDGEAWLALGNALVEHADGQLTKPALLAYRKAAEAQPDGLGAGYFLGLAFIRQGRLGDAAQLWRETLQGGAADAPGRQMMSEQTVRLERLVSGEVQLPLPEGG